VPLDEHARRAVASRAVLERAWLDDSTRAGAVAAPAAFTAFELALESTTSSISWVNYEAAASCDDAADTPAEGAVDEVRAELFFGRHERTRLASAQRTLAA